MTRQRKMLACADVPVKTPPIPALTRGIQLGLGVFVALVAVVGYIGYLRRQRPSALMPARRH
jgi:hypothetical protein